MGVGQSSTCFFKAAFGFSEDGYDETQLRLLEAAELRPAGPNDFIDIPTLPVPPERCVFRTHDQRILDAGIFYEPAVRELRAEVAALLKREDVRKAIESVAVPAAGEAFGDHRGLISLRNTVGNVKALHQKEAANGSVFQVASQFNYLEFPTPDYVPEQGITTYALDHTQGPACAMSCSAGSAYRNYLIQQPVKPDLRRRNHSRGQRAYTQRNGLHDIEVAFMQKARAELGVGETLPYREPWSVINGYVDAELHAIKAANPLLCDSQHRALLTGLLRVGVQQDTAVVDTNNLVTQVYCSAISCGYSTVSSKLWEPLATMVLRGAYEATLLVGVKNVIRWSLRTARNPVNGAAIAAAAKAGASLGEAEALAAHATVLPHLPKLYLTKVGGGVFANPSTWIGGAILSSLHSVGDLGVPLDIEIVHYGGIESGYKDLVDDFNHAAQERHGTSLDRDPRHRESTWAAE
jgi:hypothetical protein